MIVLNDFKAQWEEVRAETLEAVDRVGRSGHLILGEEVAAFEVDLARRFRLPFAAGCGNGLDAIEIALRCLRLGAGEKVLTTPLSAFATSLAILRAGGTPVFADVDDSGLLDLDLVEDLLEAREDIRFLVPVHLFGHALDLGRLEALKSRFGLKVVEDCAQAIGASHRGRPIGSVGDLAATSFYPTKNLGCMGDGGAVLTSDPALDGLARRLRNYGQSAKYVHSELGLNSRLDELQAAILRDALLPRLDTWGATRVGIGHAYIDGIKNPRIEVLRPPVGSASVFHLFPVLVAGDRHGFQAFLRERGILTGVHYPELIPDQAPIRALPGETALTSLKNAARFASTEVSLPIHPYMDAAAVAAVVDACNDWT